MKIRFVAASAALALAAGGGAIATATAASAAPAATSYQPAFGYDFASNTGAPGPTPGTLYWQVSSSPLKYPEASQSLGANGVTVTTSPDKGYADSGVVVDIGSIANNADGNGNLVVPTVKSSGSPVAVNLFFDTNGDEQYLKFNSNNVYTGTGGDKIMYSVSGTIPPTTYNSYEAPTGTSNADKGGTSTEVWAWVGVSGSQAQSATITSVKGNNLVKAVTSNPTGQISSDYNGLCLNDAGYSRADGAKVIQWQCGNYANEQYTFDQMGTDQWGDPIGHVVSKVSGKCLNDAGYAGPGGKVIQWTCGNYSNELWTYWTKWREYSLYSGNSIVCLNDPAWSTANGTQQIVWGCVNTANEHYSPVS